MKQDTSGPEYPHHYQDDVPGLTKRERYAMAAMQGLLSGDTSDGWTVASATKKAVEYADALITALEARE